MDHPKSHFVLLPGRVWAWNTKNQRSKFSSLCGCEILNSDAASFQNWRFKRISSTQLSFFLGGKVHSKKHSRITFWEFQEVLGVLLGGGNSNIFCFHPKFGEDFQFDSYFSNGLVQPPTSLGGFCRILEQHFLTPNFQSGGSGRLEGY